MEQKEGGSEYLFENILELHRSVVSIFFKGFEEVFQLPEGMNFTQMKAVLTLQFCGSMTMSKLSHMLNLEKGSFTSVAGKMMKNGIVNKEHSVEDKRVYHLVLTKEGKQLAEKFKKAHWEFATQRLEQLPSKERDDYFKMVDKLNYYNRKMDQNSQ